MKGIIGFFFFPCAFLVRCLIDPQRRNVQREKQASWGARWVLISCIHTRQRTATARQDVKLEDYAYRTYAYHDPTAKPTADGTYIVVNSDPNGAAEIEYGACMRRSWCGGSLEEEEHFCFFGKGKIRLAD